MATIPLDGELQPLALLLPTKDVQLDLRCGAVIGCGLMSLSPIRSSFDPNRQDVILDANPERRREAVSNGKKNLDEVASRWQTNETLKDFALDIAKLDAALKALPVKVRNKTNPQLWGRNFDDDTSKVAEIKRRILCLTGLYDEYLQCDSQGVNIPSVVKRVDDAPTGRSMAPAKLRVLAFGLLVLCLCVLLPDDGLSLTQLVAASGAWACVVWLWEDRATAFIRAWWKRTILLAFSLFAVAALWHYIIDVLPVEQAASRYGIERAYAEYLVTYWRNGTTRVSDEKILVAMGREKASAHIKAWVHNGGYNRNSMDLPSINAR